MIDHEEDHDEGVSSDDHVIQLVVTVKVLYPRCS